MITVNIIEGLEAYNKLGALTGDLYVRALGADPGLHDGKGNCWVVAACARGVALALGIKSRLCGGRVRNITSGEFMFSGDLHYWVILDDDVILESPNHKQIIITRKGQTGLDYIEFRRCTRGLREMVEAARCGAAKEIAEEMAGSA